MSKQLKVASDLFLDLKLYRVPDEQIKKLEQSPLNVKIEKVIVRDGIPEPPIETEIYWGNIITGETIASLPNLKWIHFGSVGVNRADVKEVIDRNIIVTNSSGIMDAAVAATGLSMMLSLARGLHHCFRLRREGNLSRKTFDRYFDSTYDLEGQTCLIVGLGQIGRRLAKVCKSLGMEVTAINRTGPSSECEVSHYFALEQLNDAVKDADYVVNLLPLTADTVRLFDKKTFLKMKQSAFFINLGRGESVAESELIFALKAGVIAGAGLDVFELEPLSAESELWNLNNVIITPHVGGLTNRYWEKATRLFEENLKLYSAGEKLINIVDMKRGY